MHRSPTSSCWTQTEHLRLSGHEVLGEIKRRDDLKHIPIVVLTCSKTEQDMPKSFRMQVDRYVTKPAGLEAFVWEMKKNRGARRRGKTAGNLACRRAASDSREMQEVSCPRRP